jgi:hypothetical protein
MLSLCKTGKMSESLKPFVIPNVEPESMRIFDLWAAKRGFKTRRPAFYYLTQAMKEGSLLVMDKPVKEILVGAAKEETLLQARLAARKEARNVLYEEGFISDPAEPMEILERAKP